MTQALQKKVSAQANEIARRDQIIERLTRENIARRRLLLNALNAVPGWEIDARAELDTRPRR